MQEFMLCDCPGLVFPSLAGSKARGRDAEARGGAAASPERSTAPAYYS